jgi:hypothetical protein
MFATLPGNSSVSNDTPHPRDATRQTAAKQRVKAPMVLKPFFSTTAEMAHIIFVFSCDWMIVCSRIMMMKVPQD